MRICECSQIHERRRVVLTGGPGAGKTAVLELVRQYFCRHVHVLPEAAGILFGGGFPRGSGAAACAAEQRAIFHVQRELEATAATLFEPALVLCDRGTIDGAAYWPGPDTLWSAVGATQADELTRYAAVIHLRTPPALSYNHANPLRLESAAEAAAIDARIEQAWAGHPRRFFVESTTDFLEKAHRALQLVRAELPACCREHTFPGASIGP
jgi:predicted ATPase